MTEPNRREIAWGYACCQCGREKTHAIDCPLNVERSDIDCGCGKGRNCSGQTCDGKPPLEERNG